MKLKFNKWNFTEGCRLTRGASFGNMVIRRIARSLLTILAIGSFGFSIYNLHALWQNPIATILVEHAKEDITTRIEKQLSIHVNQRNIEIRLAKLLDEKPRNWLVIEAVEGIALEQGIVIGSNLHDKREAAYDEDHGFIVGTGKCAACAWNPTACDLSAVLLCRAPIDLTPVGDVFGIVRESKHYVFGDDVDMFELGLSVIGLSAIVLVPITGGTSATVKVGASVAKTAKRMGRISPNLLRLMNQTFEEAIDWDIIAKTSIGNYISDIKRSVNTDAIRPAMTTIVELGSIRTAVGITDTLHLIKYIDTPEDARVISRVADAMGNQTVGVFKTLGKSRVIKSTMRYGDEFIGLIEGIVGMIVALLGFVFSFLGSIIIRFLRVFANPKRGEQ